MLNNFKYFFSTVQKLQKNQATFIKRPVMRFRILQALLPIAGLLILLSHCCFSQGTAESYMSFDPSNTESRIPVSFDSYYFSGGHRFYSLDLGYRYGLANKRHMMGITIPVVHNIFNGDYGGFENTTGIGDLRFIYLGVPYTAKKNALGFKRLAALSGSYYAYR